MKRLVRQYLRFRENYLSVIDKIRLFNEAFSFEKFLQIMSLSVSTQSVL